MLERLRRGRHTETGDERGSVARDEGDSVARGEREGERAAGAREVAHEARARQRDEFGGLNWGASFFGWLVAIGVAVILTAIVSAAGAAVGLTEVNESDADTVGIVGGALLIGIFFLAYYAGGYVAGRMSRFDGGRQGLGVWLIGLLVTILLAAAGAIAGSEYNVFQRLELPRIPIDEGSLTTGGVIALAAVLLATLVGALLGGKSGQRYHRRVDRVGYDAARAS